MELGLRHRTEKPGCVWCLIQGVVLGLGCSGLGGHRGALAWQHSVTQAGRGQGTGSCGWDVPETMGHLGPKAAPGSRTKSEVGWDAGC